MRQQLELTPYVVNPVFPSTEATPLSFPEEEQPCSRIDALVLQGKAAQDFQFALSEVRQPANEGGALGRCLGGRGIQMVIARVQSAIIERGFTTTRVLVQPQDLSSGTLVLTLAPGRVRKLRMSAWELSVHHRHFIGSAVLEGNLGYRRALDRQGQEAQDELDLPQIVSRYALWLADAAWNVPWQWGDARLRYSGAARAQWNRGGVPTQDQFAIGGRYTVRGFDGELTLQAERGWLLRNEVALALGASGQEIYAGFDSGAVAGALTQNLTGRRLSGAVLGWRGSLDKLGYELFVATPLARPAGWASASVTGGFNLQWTY